MSERTPLLTLLAVLCLPLPALAESAEFDPGALQAELARVEAERQRLADELDGRADNAQLEQLSSQNLALQEQLTALQQTRDSQRNDQQRKWFITGASTVALSLLAGWLLAQLGGRRKRSMWLN